MAEHWRERMLTFDVESSGVNVETDRIVTATAAWVSRSGAEPTTWLIDPGIEIPQGATDVHGITTEYARTHGRQPMEALEEVAAVLGLAWVEGVPVVGFNIAYDLTILDRELRRHGLPALDPDGCRPVLDPLVIDKAVDQYRRGGRKLVDLCGQYGVALNGAHDATEDALATGRLAWNLPRFFPGIRDMPIGELHDAQMWWKHQQAESLRAFWTRKGDPRAVEVDGSWPIRPHPEYGPLRMPDFPKHQSGCSAIGDPTRVCSCNDHPEWTT